jgi:hypothetical protein
LFDEHPLVVPITVYTVVVVGDTFNVDALTPVFQLYVVAPVAVSNVFDPEQIVELFTVIVGCAVTTTFTVVEPVHVPLKPTMVYVVLPVGVTVTELPFVDIGNHVYVVAPAAVNVAVPPEQILAELDVMDNAPLTLTEPVAVLVQLPFDPVTVYVVLLPGDTTKVVFVVEPGVHV